jgi:4-alpha-glucanotransferase
MFPLQDLLGLDGSARMNLPGTVGGNWSWRFDRGALTAALAADCRRRAEESRRLAPEAPGIPRPLPLTA